MTVSGDRHERIARIAEVQRGRISREQLRAVGISNSTIQRLVASGRLVRVHRSVYAVRPIVPVAFVREAAALLACGPNAVLSHASAAAVWGLFEPDAAEVHVTIPWRRHRHHPGIHAHRTAQLLPRDVRIQGELPVTSPARTLLDEAGILNARDVERQLDEALNVLRIARPEDIEDVLNRAKRRPGAPLLRRLLASRITETITQSEAERLFLRLVREAGLPEPETQAKLEGFTVDFLWPRRAPSGAAASIAQVSALADLPLLASGKVREIYDAGETLLIVASDRVSTYDVVHPNPIPDKGKVLTGLSTFWFERTAELVPNHLLSVAEGVPEEARGRGMAVRKLDMLPVECVVRGYITGSGWKDYRATGAVCGIGLPAGLRESDRLPEPIFTPTTKATTGHDEAVDFEGAVRLVGDRAVAERLREGSISVYEHAAEHARQRGIILADTKFEFGLDSGGTLTLGDEVCTPDSSRFWPAEEYEPGHGQPSFDKQFVRDWASSTGWDRNPPAPEIPEDIVARTREKYLDAYERITGERFEEWLRRTAA